MALSWDLLLWQVCCVSASIGSFRSWWGPRAAMACTAVVKTLTQKTPAQEQEQQEQGQQAPWQALLLQTVGETCDRARHLVVWFDCSAVKAHALVEACVLSTRPVSADSFFLSRPVCRCFICPCSCSSSESLEGLLRLTVSEPAAATAGGGDGSGMSPSSGGGVLSPSSTGRAGRRRGQRGLTFEALLDDLVVLSFLVRLVLMPGVCACVCVCACVRACVPKCSALCAHSILQHLAVLLHSIAQRVLHPAMRCAAVQCSVSKAVGLHRGCTRQHSQYKIA